MKNFRFASISLLSRKERRARTIEFHPKRNLILGRNHGGKSSLIRALFETLGAMPQGKLALWDQDVISVVDFTVDQVSYRAIRQRGNRALFDAHGKLLVATGSHLEWTSCFASTTGFNLVFSDKESETQLADASCFFLPFYINQDGSWQAEWNTFKGLKRYKSPQGAILEYFSGVKPPEYYELRAERDKEAKALDEIQKELKILGRARERFGKSISLSGPKVNPDNFESEINRLTVEVNELNKRQETLREAAVKQQELIASLAQQIHASEDALRTYEGDVKFLHHESTDQLTCPTCGAEHQHSFIDYLGYAEDARVLRELTSRLRDEMETIRKKYQLTLNELKDLEGHYQRLSGILNTRRGNMAFKEVVESLGAESAYKAFEDETKELEKDVNTRRTTIDNFESKMEKLVSKKRSTEILTKFREYYASARHALNLPGVDLMKMRLSSRPDLSGSGGPRSILAYYAAIWRVSNSEHGAFSVPVVIDSPNQQGQDDVNLPAVLKFIANDLPKNLQLIVGLEHGTDYEFEKTIELDNPYHLLREEVLEEVEKNIGPFIDQLYQRLADQDKAVPDDI